MSDERLTMTAEEAGEALGMFWRTVCMLGRAGHLRMRAVLGEPERVTHTGYGPLGWSTHGYTHTPATFYFNPAEVEAIRPRAWALVSEIAAANEGRLRGLIAEVFGPAKEVTVEQ